MYRRRSAFTVYFWSNTLIKYSSLVQNRMFLPYFKLNFKNSAINPASNTYFCNQYMVNYYH